MQCFITSAQTLNFTKTSQLLYISQPTVTHHILNLEEELGFKLFARTKKQIALTVAGESFYKSMTKISSEFNEAVMCARKCDEDSKNHICIGCGS
jgi:DNA-binding transcriptional LysR family regulator